MKPTSEKSLRRLETFTAGGRADQDLDLMPGFLEIAARHIPGAYQAIQDTPAWHDFMSPFSKRASQIKIEAEIKRRLDALVPVLRQKGDEEVTKLFLSLLVWPEIADFVLPEPRKGRKSK